jgi:hypothetical protein
MEINVSIDSKQLNKATHWLAEISGQMPYATSRALNDAAKEAVKDLNASTTTYFDRPTPFTQKGYTVTGYSSKKDLKATLNLKPLQAKYLLPSIKGGVRPQRPSERKASGVAAYSPGLDVKLNASGNMSKAQAVAALKGGGTFFTVKQQKGKLKPGVYQRMAKGKIRNILGFNALPAVKQRWPLDRVVGKSVTRHLPSRLNYWMDQVLKAK